MLDYAAEHQQIEARRVRALHNWPEGGEPPAGAVSPGGFLYERGYGPRVLVVGSTDNGKSTLVHILSAYAARLGRSPIMVDLDPGQGDIALPGCVAATPVNVRSFTVEVR